MYYTPRGFGAFKFHHCQMHISRDRGKTFQLAGLMSDIGAFLAQQSVVRIPGTAWLVVSAAGTDLRASGGGATTDCPIGD